MVCICSYLKSLLIYKFLILNTYIRTIYIHVNKDVRIRGSFWKSKAFRKQKSSVNIRIDNSFVEEFYFGLFRSITVPKLKEAVMRIYKVKKKKIS
jgi:hypothetical protein